MTTLHQQQCLIEQLRSGSAKIDLDAYVNLKQSEIQEMTVKNFSPTLIQQQQDELRLAVGLMREFADLAFPVHHKCRTDYDITILITPK